jgi:hypothetical protein
MSWAQTWTLVATILVAVLGGVIYGNKRIDDLRADMNTRFDDMGKRFDDLHKRIDDLQGHMMTLREELAAGLREVREALRARTP